MLISVLALAAREARRHRRANFPNLHRRLRAFEYADILRVMDVLLNDIRVDAVFSDFPLTAAAFANCLSR